MEKSDNDYRLIQLGAMMKDELQMFVNAAIEGSGDKSQFPDLQWLISEWEKIVPYHSDEGGKVG